MPDTTQELIEMKRRITDLDAEVRRMRGRLVMPQRRFPAGQAGMALVLGLVLSTMMPSAMGAQNSPVVEADLVKRIKTLEDKLAHPLTVKAPFQVVDAGGKVILSAALNGSQPLLTVGGTTASGGVALGVGTVSGAGFVSVSTAEVS